MERKVIVEKNLASKIDDVYNDLSDIKDALYFLNRATLNEDNGGLNDIDNYNNGKALLIESISNKLKNTMDTLKKINTMEEEEIK